MPDNEWSDILLLNWGKDPIIKKIPITLFTVTSLRMVDMFWGIPMVGVVGPSFSKMSRPRIDVLRSSRLIIDFKL